MPRPQVSFFTAGERFAHNGSYIIVNHAYVQYIPPVDLKACEASENLPLIFIHGGGLTGAMWEATPDRRPGWAVLASRPPFNRPVYLLDTVDSGRSQRCPPSLRSDENYEHRNAAEGWQRFRLGDPAGFPENGPGAAFEGSQFPVDHLDALVGIQSARRRGDEQNAAEMMGIAAAIREIGHCQIIAHSNGAGMTVGALRRDKEAKHLVEKIVLVEPSSPVDESVDIYPTKPLAVWGDYFDKKYARMRGLIRHYEDGLRDVELWDLPARFGIRGNTHFLMSDRNSDDIVRLILEWLD